MTRSWYLLPAAALFLWSGAAEARRLPDRAQVERAVNAWFACRAGPDCAGWPAYRRQLTRSRCYRLPGEEAYPGRILCIFSGVDHREGRPASPFRNDCAYLMPTRRGWQVSSIPDADVCE
ncbi:MAG TPA: hypothetical protein VEC11_11125 [Allosphingosinicella sp.]|nr:hypothetical protein [Allosphingosinicella sp.]